MVNEEAWSASKPLVSVVIVNYNAGPVLTESIRAALPQVSEILIADNASSDLSAGDCARQVADEPPLKILRSDVNLGLAAAYNIGFSKTKGDFM